MLHANGVFLGPVSSEHSAGDKQNRGEITSAAVSGLRNKLMSKRLGDDQTFSFRYLSSARFHITRANFHEPSRCFCKTRSNLPRKLLTGASRDSR